MIKTIHFFRVLFGFSFVFSAYTKGIAPGYFEITLMDQGIANSRNIAQHLTRFFIGLEFALGLALILPFYSRKILRFAQVLLFIFTVHLFYLWFAGSTENCGCFGEMISMSPEESIVKNLVLLVISFAIQRKLTLTEKKNPWVLILWIAMIGSMWLFLPISNQAAHNFQEFTHFEKAGRVDLLQGEKLIAVFNLDCEHCQEEAKKLAELQKNQDQFPLLYILFFKEGATSPEDFEVITGSNFPYTMIDVNTFFDLIGNSPPRVYYLSQGSIKEFWDKEITENIAKTFALE